MNVSFEDVMDYVRGLIGASAAISFPFMEELSGLVQLAGGFGGLFLVWLSIRHKRMQIKNEQRKKPF